MVKASMSEAAAAGAAAAAAAAVVCTAWLEGRLPTFEKFVRGGVCLILNPNGEAEKLSSSFKKIQELLMDAEKKAITNRRVKSWVDKLRDLSYDIDAVLEKWHFLRNIRRELEDATESSDSLRQTVSSFPESFRRLLREGTARLTTAREIQKLNERLDSIAEENENEFKFIPNLDPESQDFTRVISTSIIKKDSELHGRGNDLKLLMNKLHPEPGSEGVDAIQILSLVGVGGIGKTALAQLAFSAAKKKGRFDMTIWICVSHPFDGMKIAKQILEALIKKESPSLSGFDNVLQHIKDSVNGKKFFLVLDDVWTEKDAMWASLITSLTQSDAPGSRILLTTRNKNVVTETKANSQMQQLDPLSDSDCWSVLKEEAFHDRNDGDRAMLEDTGLKIALKCKGLPLAAKIIGGLLSSKRSLAEWQAVLNSGLWALEEVSREIFPSLELSYNELDPVAKRCLSYCAIFPKDSVLDVTELIRSWMARGFISSSETGGEILEAQGRSFFNKLANRCFFQEFKLDPYMDSHIMLCKMHDVIHDFVQVKTNNECLIVEKIDEEAMTGKKRRRPNILGNEAKRPRHLNILGNEAKNLNRLISNSQTKELCSVLCPHNDIPLDFFSRLEQVRWLNLRDCNLVTIPSELGDLIHIRYLDLSLNNSLEKIPESICRLYNLQALNTKHCLSLSEFPRGFNKLKNLRHLLIYGTAEKFFIQGIDELDNLRELDYFTYNRNSSNKLGHLKDLNKVGGYLHIYICDLNDEYDHLGEAKRAELKNKTDIYHLTLEFGMDVRKEIIEALEPSPNLHCLDFSSPHLPNWMANLTNLRKLRISGVRNEIEDLESLRILPFLEELKLVSVKLERLTLNFFGLHTTPAEAKPNSLTCEIVQVPPMAFPKLKKLYIHYCRELKEWEDIGGEDGDMINVSVLPCLQILQLHMSPDLMVLPHRLLRMASSLRELELIDCGNLQERYHEGTGQDRDKISHIPNVRIH